MYVDADTHVDECEDTWAYMPKELVPTTLSLAQDQIPPWLVRGADASSAQNRFWFMDGQLHSRRIRNDARSGTTVDTRELYDVAARVRDMDTLNVETQVLFPTVLLCQLTQRADLDIALCKSYNRWLAERCADTGGRLRWVAMPPLSSIPDAVEELRFAKEHGAVGVFKRGVEWDASASDPYFFPVYAAAQELDMPICIHSSLPWAALDSHFTRARPIYCQGFLGVTVLQAFYALVSDRIPERFPDLRFGFIEAGSTWLPYLFDTLRVKDTKDLISSSNFFVTCEVAEDVPYVIEKVGEENLFVGTDYSHGDRASVMYAHSKIADRSDITDKAATKITSENARRFYGL